MQMNTTARGYGNAHQRERRRLLAELVPGTACGFCGEPMDSGQPLDLDHSDPATRLLGMPGDRLTHRSCNRRDSVRRLLMSRGKTACECVICGKQYVPNHQVRTCGRKCGWELRRRNQKEVS